MSISEEALAGLLCLYLALFCNGSFVKAALAGASLASPWTWLHAGMLVAVLASLHFLLVLPVVTRRTGKPVVVILLLLAAAVSHFMRRYQVVFNPDMLSNVLATDWFEARDLVTGTMILHVAVFAGLPASLLLRVRVAERSWRKGAVARLVAISLALLVLVAGALLAGRNLVPRLREQPDLRYQITPGNVIYSLLRATREKIKNGHVERKPVGTDVTLGPTLRGAVKPAVLVVVVGETVRAANWGLSGYSRQTTPRLAASGVVNFDDVTACGTSTETALPCLFSPFGRWQFDEARIRGSESLLDVVARAGFRVVWVDNQSGCKGVCDGVESIRPDPAAFPEFCVNGECMDGVLVPSLRQLVSETPGNLMVVLHQIGNHGPAYYRRYPPEFREYTPSCESSDLSRCSREEVLNAYDNAVRYTDHVLGEILHVLESVETHMPVMLYVSDHGESLGEGGFYLHGLPYWLAPDTQLKVPMVLWMSTEFAHERSIDLRCIEQRARQPVSHDHVFHSLVGLLDLRTTIYRPELDFSSHCRGGLEELELARRTQSSGP